MKTASVQNKTDTFIPSPVESRPCSCSSKRKYIDTISSKPSPIAIFCEDFVGFVRNLCLWPVHGFHLFMDSFFLIVFFPLIPIILVTGLIRVIIEAFTGCFLGTSIQKSFALTDPSPKQRAYLENILSHCCYTRLPQEKFLELLHIFQSYLSLAQSYDKMKKNSYLQVLIKINVDGKTKIFTFKPEQNQKKLLKQYLAFIDGLAKENSVVKHTFVKIDYFYQIGLCKMDVSTDTVAYEINHEVEVEPPCCYSFFLRKIFPGFKIMKIFPAAKHTAKEEAPEHHFAFWPGNTRRAICDLINKNLEENDLNEYQVSLLELSELIR